MRMNPLLQYIQKLTKRTLLIVLISFTIGALVSSLFWQYKFKDSQSSLDYKNFEIKNLEDQISVLRDERYAAANPSPTPTPIPYVKKENLDSQNIYSLSCYNPSEDKSSPSWVKTLEEKLESEEKLVNACLNETLNKIVFISTKVADKGGFGRPGVNDFKFGVFNISDSKIEVLSASQGSYLGGSCGTLKAWTKSDNIYYECGGGDGPWGTVQTYRLSIQTKEKGIVENCYTFGDKTSCTTYCQSSSDCKQGYICNLEKNNCVQSCKTDKDCVNSACKPLGPILACVQ